MGIVAISHLLREATLPHGGPQVIGVGPGSRCVNLLTEHAPIVASNPRYRCGAALAAAVRRSAGEVKPGWLGHRTDATGAEPGHELLG